MGEGPDADAAPLWAGPLFLVGMPRSGTKLLRDLLNQHPRVAIPRVETEFLPDWARRWDSFGDLRDRARFEAFYQAVSGSSYFTYMAEDEGGQAGLDEWFAACDGGSLAAVMEALVRVDTGTVGQPEVIWGDKSPGYISHLPLLEERFTGARFIHIVRDVRDYALSMQKAWGKHPVRAAQRWVDGVSRAHATGGLLGAHRYLELRYEDLLDDPQAVLERVCTFLSIDFQPGMLELDRSTENLGDTKGLTAIQRGNKEKWRERMDPALRERIEAISCPLLHGLGYPCDYEGPTSRLNRRELLAYQLRDGVNLVRADTKRRGLLGALRFRTRLFKETGGLD